MQGESRAQRPPLSTSIVMLFCPRVISYCSPDASKFAYRAGMTNGGGGLPSTAGGRRQALYVPSLTPGTTFPPPAGVEGERPVLLDRPAGQLRGIADRLKLDVVPRQVLDFPLALAHDLTLDRVNL